MPNFSFSNLVLYFVLYSIIGWFLETIYCSIGKRKLVNRGFLVGPWCPIYGFGSLFILGILVPLGANPLIIFLISLATSSLLEYVTSWIMESLFQIRWWDYSHRRFNIKGRICLGNSLLFGLMGVILSLALHPFFQQHIQKIPPESQRIIASFLVALLVADLIYTLNMTLGLKERLRELKVIFFELEDYQREYTCFDKSDPKSRISQLREICEKDEKDETLIKILVRIEEIAHRKKSGSRMVSAFPKMQPHGMNAELEALRNELKQKKKKYIENGTRQWAEWKHYIKHSYKDISITTLIWIFLIGSVIGYIVETLYCFITTGVLESRQGLVYGPFSQVYGFGAVAMSLLLTSLVRKNNIWMFCGSAIIGGLFEILCSLIQEYVFLSVSWKYPNDAFSLFGGRTSLKYMFFWGLLGTVYMRLIHPKIIDLFNRMTGRPRHFFTVIISIIVCLDMILSVIAIGRWRERSRQVEATNIFEKYIDERFPDNMLEEIYPNLKFVIEDGQINVSPL